MKTETVLNLTNPKRNGQIVLASLVLCAMTAITFGFAIIAVPIAGANVAGQGIPYPYLDTFGQFPRDFAWQALAVLQLAVYLWLFSLLPGAIGEAHRPFAEAARTFALASGIILIIDYYVQFSVVPISLRSGELDGLPLLIQYNSHGLFIALEEIGYILMSLSFAFLGQALADAGRKMRFLRCFLRLPLAAGLVLFVLISAKHGLNRQDRFEVWIISLDWLVLLVATPLLASLFRAGRIPASAPETAAMPR